MIIHSELKQCIEKATAVQRTIDQLRRSDDYTLLQRATLTMDEIEGVFVKPPQCTPRSVDVIIFNGTHCSADRETSMLVFSFLNVGVM